jgi:hypothetical protein
VAFLIAILTLVVAGAVVLIVGAPLRRARRTGWPEAGASAGLASSIELASSSSGYEPDELESAREAKYREIRDAELDFRTGKLSREDYEAIDADLRTEAIDILNRLQPAERQAAAQPEEQSRSGPGTLQQQEGVQEEHHGEEDRPAI